MAEPRPRPEVEALVARGAAAHGGGAAPGVLDCSTGVSPLPTPPAIVAAARAAALDRYPHPTAAPLGAAVAAAHGGGADEVVAGAGSVELIWALARAFGGPGRSGLVVAPAFGEYAQALAASGARVVEARGDEPPFAPPAAALADALAAQPALAFVARPASPALWCAAADEVDAWARATPSTLWVLDEAYQPLCDDVAPLPRGRDNVVRLRSLTKLFALPGLRVGYLLAAPAVARAVQAMLPPWNVAAPALAAAVAALGCVDEAAAVAPALARLRARQIERLHGPAPLVAARGPFLLYRVGDAAAWTRRLLGRGVLVRDATSFGLPAHVRVGVRAEPDQERLAAAWHAREP